MDELAAVAAVASTILGVAVDLTPATVEAPLFVPPAGDLSGVKLVVNRFFVADLFGLLRVLAAAAAEAFSFSSACSPLAPCVSSVVLLLPWSAGSTSTSPLPPPLPGPLRADALGFTAEEGRRGDFQGVEEVVLLGVVADEGRLEGEDA